MKTLRLIGLAIVAIVMSVNFAACGDDDDEPTTGNATLTIDGNKTTLNHAYW